jgi:hypothetical protein
MNKYLTSPNLHIRFIAFFLLASVLFIGVWVASYYAFPEGMLRGQRGLGSLASEDSHSLIGEGMRIFTLNLIPVGLILIFNRLMKINSIPLGYIVPLVNLIGYAVFLGTNSFMRPLAEPMAPSFKVLTRSGPYEMAALLLLAVSTHSIAIFEIRKLFITNPEKVTPAPRLRLNKEQWIGVIIGLALLLGSAFREAYMIVK